LDLGGSAAVPALADAWQGGLTAFVATADLSGTCD
jgi:hypothetical protein